MARAKTPKDNSTVKPAAKPTIISRAEPREIRTLPEDVQARIRERAYQLWEQRGHHHGNAEQDWLQAEKEILGRRQERTA